MNSSTTSLSNSIPSDASSSPRASPNHSSKSTTSSKDPGLPLTRPRIVIPAQSLSLARNNEAAELNSEPVPVITPKGSSSSRVDAGKEKVGRWSEEEHKVFLEGLGKHGKQWKVIAGMIGTRTVVQVRTHAQKYFQRMERHNNSGAAKRKMSLPASLPSRNKKSKGTKKSSIPRSASVSLVSASESPTQEIMSTHPSYVSNASSDSSWSCTISPSGVADVIDHLESFHTLQNAPFKEATVDTSGENLYDFKGLGQDPLEWLVDAEPSMLPESSLPMFPDLSSTTAPDTAHVSQLHQHETHDSSNMDTSDLQLLEPSSVVNDAVLNSIADPTVTVQSLFLLPENDC